MSVQAATTTTTATPATAASPTLWTCRLPWAYQQLQEALVQAVQLEQRVTLAPAPQEAWAPLQWQGVCQGRGTAWQWASACPPQNRECLLSMFASE